MRCWLMAGYCHRQGVVPSTGETHWEVGAVDDARAAAAKLGRGKVMAAVRYRLEFCGYTSTNSDEIERCFADFPEAVAQARAVELWPMLDPDSAHRPIPRTHPVKARHHRGTK